MCEKIEWIIYEWIDFCDVEVLIVVFGGVWKFSILILFGEYGVLCFGEFG